MEQTVKDKRIECIIQTWETLGEKGLVSNGTMYLSMPLLEETVEYYLSDWNILRKRYNIKDKIQLHKVAGLIANAVVRVKPIVPMPNTNTFHKDSEIYANETLAIYQGLAICSEYDNERNITKEAWFDKWFDDFLFMMHHRRYTAESLMFIFETISRIYFPNGLKKEET